MVLKKNLFLCLQSPLRYVMIWLIKFRRVVLILREGFKRFGPQARKEFQMFMGNRKRTVVLMGLAASALAIAPAAARPAAAAIVLPSGLLVNFESANYDATTGVWTDTSGNSNNASVANAATYNQLGSNGTPTLVANATPNGSSAVQFTTSATSPGTLGQSLGLTSALSSSTGFTIFAYILPSTAMATTNGGFVGGQSGSLEYRLANGYHQDLLLEDTADLGMSSTALSTTAWNSINVTASGAGGSGGYFRFNGNADGTTSAPSAAFQPIEVIGDGNVNGSEYFAGEIAGLQIYSGELTSAQRQTVETYFTDTYVNSIPEPAALALMAAGGLGLLLIGRRGSGTRAKA